MRKPPIVIVLVIGVLAMSSAALFIRLAQGDGLPALFIAALRMILATLLLLPLALRQRIWQEYATLRMNQVLELLLSGVLLGLHFAAWISSLEYTSVLVSVVLVTTTPLWVSLFSPLTLRERPPLLMWPAIAIALLGGYIISGGSAIRLTPGALPGPLLALLGAISAAAYFIAGRRLRSSLSLSAYIWLVYAVAAVSLGAAVLVRGDWPQHVESGSWLWLVLLAAIPQLIGHSAANYAVRHVTPAVVAIATLGEPIGSALLAMLFLGEFPSGSQWIGSLVILGGIGLAAYAESKRNPKQTSDEHGT